MSDPGALAGGGHRLHLRVYYEDTDASGIVYYANHLKFAERARTELLRDLGMDHRTLLERFGLAFAVRRCHADYLSPARLDDLLEVETRLVRLGGASIDLVQTIRRDGGDLVRLDIRLALLDRSGRAARLPADLAGMLAPLRPPGAAGSGLDSGNQRRL